MMSIAKHLHPAIVVALLALALPAGATLKAIEDAAELPLAQAVLPGEGGGIVPVRKCTTCRPFMVTVGADTPCFVQPGRTAVPLREFLRAARSAPPAGKTYLYVYFNPANRHATRLVLATLKR